MSKLLQKYENDARFRTRGGGGIHALEGGGGEVLPVCAHIFKQYEDTYIGHICVLLYMHI
jgi:hypothetical protein